MYKKLFSILTLLMVISHVVIGQWVELNTIPNQTIKKFNFITDDIGYALIYDLSTNKELVLKTTDGGNQWDSIAGLNLLEFMDISFIKDSVGFSVYRDLNNLNSPMKIYKTNDDGNNWLDVSPNSTNAGMGNSVVQFLDENVGFWGVGSVLYKTTNGGNTWDTTLLNGTTLQNNVSIMSMDFIDQNNGVIGTWDNSFFYSGSMYSTNDGGNTFNVFNLNTYSTVVNHVNYMNNNTVYASCIDVLSNERTPFISKSLDGGVSWDSIPIDTFNIYNAKLKTVDFTDDLNGKIVLKTLYSDTAYVFKTNDGAQSWVFEDTVFLYDVKDLQITENTAYLGGDVNEIYKLNSTVDVLNDSEYKAAISIYPNPNNGAFYINSSFTIYEMKIFNIQGELILQKTVNNNKQLEINLSGSPKGIYIIQLINQQDKVEINKKLIIK